MFDEIKANIAMVDVIGKYTNNEIQPNGQTKCVFHDDKKPYNFFARKTKDKTFGKCFRCNWYGDILNYVKDLFNLENEKAAAIKIIEDFGLSIKIKNKNNTSKEKPAIYTKIKEIEQKLNEFCEKKYEIWAKIFKITRTWLLENENNFGSDYEFVFWLNKHADKFCIYYEKNLNDLENRINICTIVDRRWQDEIKNRKLYTK